MMTPLKALSPPLCLKKKKKKKERKDVMFGRTKTGWIGKWDPE